MDFAKMFKGKLLERAELPERQQSAMPNTILQTFLQCQIVTQYSQTGLYHPHRLLRATIRAEGSPERCQEALGTKGHKMVFFWCEALPEALDAPRLGHDDLSRCPAFCLQHSVVGRCT